MGDLLKSVSKTYHGCEVSAWMVEDRQCYRWQFSVTRDGIQRVFIGVPNYCETARQALRRGWWRAKWINEGTFGERYQTANPLGITIIG